MKKPSKIPLSEMIPVRKTIQMIFLIITLFIGIQFYLFVAQLEAGVNLTIERPPGVEAFLPISALVSLKYFLFTGIFNGVHPSALVIFLIICATALVLRKGFCSWICPFGLLSDLLTQCHLFLFKKQIALPRWADWILRGIKYAIAFFFLWSIFIKMPVEAIGQFIASPYNQFSDIKMLEFFTHISQTALAVIIVLLVLSLVIPNFWCRYLCPYGALIGLIGFFSTGKIKRSTRHCLDCKQCEHVCPGRIQITKHSKINSLECSACLRCVDACPDNRVLKFSIFNVLTMGKKQVAVTLAALFTIGIFTAKQTGHWQNDIPIYAYKQYVMTRQMKWEMPKDPEKMKRMMEMMRKMQENQ